LRLRVKGGPLLEAGDAVLVGVGGLQDGAEVVVEPDTLDSEYPAWMAAPPRARPAVGGSSLSLQRDGPGEVSALSSQPVPTPAVPKAQTVHDFGCTCFRCIKRRQFRR